MEIITPIDKIRIFLESKFPNKKLKQLDNNIGYEMTIKTQDDCVYCDFQIGYESNQIILSTDEFVIHFDTLNELERMFDELLDYDFADVSSNTCEKEFEEWIKEQYCDVCKTFNNYILRWETPNGNNFYFFNDGPPMRFFNKKTRDSIQFDNIEQFKRYYNYVK